MCTNKVASCLPNCFDQNSYFECQSKCIEKFKLGPSKCLRDDTCRNNCNLNCEKLWKGKLDENVKYAIFEYTKRSALPNPYGTKRDSWKWPYIINILAKSSKKQKLLSRSIQRSDIKPEDTPEAFSDKKDTRLESAIPTWDISVDELVQFYVRAYKERFIDWTYGFADSCNKYKRRISWLYAEDGCFARAQHFGKKIVELVRRQNNNAIFNDPFKHYMFGSLVSHVKEMGKKIREVTWDNHVAPIGKLRDNALYILDPLVSNRPMKRDEYHSALESTGSKIKGYVTCQPDTYGHEDDCFNPDKMEAEKLKTHNELTSMHLMIEWSMQRPQGRDPEDVLIKDSGSKYYPWW